MKNRPPNRFLTLLSQWQRHFSRSLHIRLIALSAGAFVTLLWGLTFFSSALFQKQFAEIIFDQQFAAAQRLAEDLDNKLTERVHDLEAAASLLPAALSPDVLAEHLPKFVGLHSIFSGGIAVIGLDGKAIADYPIARGRQGTYFGDRAYFARTVATKKPYIDTPVFGRALNRPALTIAVPVRGHDGTLRAVMTGITDLSAPDFLGIHLNHRLSDSPEFLVIAPHDNVIIAATDRKRILTSPQRQGENPVYDSFVAGFEGSGIAVSALGISHLYSGKSLKAADWLVMAALPTEIAFRPLVKIQTYLIGAAAFITLLAILLIVWITSRALAPLGAMGKAMRKMAEGKSPITSLNDQSDEEIEALIDNFNVVVEDRDRSQQALSESEQRFRALVENAPDAIFVQSNGCFAYVNAATLRLLGAHAKEQLLGQRLITRLPYEYHAMVEARIQAITDTRETVSPFEQKFFRLDGSLAYAELSAIPFFYEGAQSSLIFARDITDRKLAVRALRESEDRFHRLVELSSEWYWELDDHYRFTKIFGWSTAAGSIDSAQFIGKTRWELSNDVDVSTWMAHRAVLDEHRPFADFEYRIRALNGGVVWFSISGEPKFSDDGTFTGYYGTGKNITRRKLAEEAMRTSQMRIRELAMHQEQVKEDERKRIARDIHDDLGQMLLVLRIAVSTLIERKEAQSPTIRQPLSEVLGQIDATTKSVRRIINDLRPSVLDLGLLAAIEWLLNDFKRSSGIAPEMIVNDDSFDCQLDERCSATLFRAVQESLTNIVRHARASVVRIAIENITDRLSITVADDGIGIEPEAAVKKNSFGLLGIEERLRALGGTFLIKSRPGMGTTLTFSIPNRAHCTETHPLSGPDRVAIGNTGGPPLPVAL